MSSNLNLPRLKWPLITLALLSVSAPTRAAHAQNVPSVHLGRVEITGVPDDWTHHHVVFSNPGTEQDAIRTGRYEQWQHVVNEPRYVIQQLKQNLAVQGPAATDAQYRAQWISSVFGVRGSVSNLANADASFGFGHHNAPNPNPSSTAQRDWSMTSGGTGGLAAGHYPAKYQFTTNAEDCTTDYVAFPTGIAGTTTQATLIAYNNIYKSTCSGNVPSILLSINTGGLADTSPVLSLDGTQVAYIQTPIRTIVATVLKHGTTFDVTTGTLTSSDVGAAISGPGIPTGDTIASVTTSTSGTLTSGATQETDATLTITDGAQLVLLKMGSGGTAVNSPVSPASVTNANYRACTAPCYTTLSLNGSPSDSNSAPFYVYPDSTNGSPDIMYVGDDDGSVHKFTNLFLSGTPAEVTTNWPAAVSTETNPELNSPIYDSVSGYIFVGDQSGYLHQFAAGTKPGTVYTSGRLAYNTLGLDPPLIDDTSGTDTIYQFVGYSDDTTNHRPSYLNVFTATGTTSIVGGSQYGTQVWFPNGTTSSRAAGTSTMMYTATFDNTYFNGSGNTGNIYACSDGVLYQIPLATISSSVVNTFSTPTSAASTCSPVTEFYNSTSGSDYLFMSVAKNAVASGGSTCTGACVFSYVAPTSTSTHTGTPAAGLSAAGGTSGIIIDNAASGGGSEIYFTSIGSESCNGVSGSGSTGNGTGSCAVQATQAALQ